MADYLIHFANVLFVASYSVRDILWLRVLTIVAMLSMLPYYYTRPDPLLAAIAWNGLFLAINGWQLWRLVLERRPVRLTLEQQRLYELAFSSLSPREFVKLATIGTWESVTAKAMIVELGQTLTRLTFIVDGRVRVEADGEILSELGAGQFVGEVAYVTGKPACATVIAEGSCRVIAWESDRLRAHLTANPTTRAAMQNVIGSDLATKLRAEPPRVASLSPAPA